MLIHFAVNALVLALGYYWLGLAESRMGALAWSALVAVAAAALAMWAYAASFVYREETSAVAAWRVVLRNVPAVIAATIVVALLYWGLAQWAIYSAKPAFRIASYLTLTLRKPIRPASVGLVFATVLWVVRWVLLPVAFLPVMASVASLGWPGFRITSRRPNWFYWIATPVLLWCFLHAPLLLINWVPRVSGFRIAVGELRGAGAGGLSAVRRRVAGTGFYHLRRQTSGDPPDHGGFAVSADQTGHFGVGLCVGAASARGV